MLDDVLRRLLPDWVAVHTLAYDEGDGGDDDGMPPEVARAVPKRRAEFRAGRQCARAALIAAGGPGDAEIPIGPLRNPIWPAGYVGSISHAHGIAAAAVAPTSRTRALGIDLERTITDAGLAPYVANPDELRLAPLAALFAAKEALFKALSPHVLTYFDFLEAAAIAAADDRLALCLLADLTAEFPAGTLVEARVATAPDDWTVAVVHLAC